MSDPQIRGPLSAVVIPIAETAAKIPADKRAEARAYWGAYCVTLCGFTAMTLDAANFPVEWLYGWAACGGLGLLLLISGLRNARGPRDPVKALFVILLPVAGGVGMVMYWPELWDVYLVRAVYISTGAANLVRFWLAIRGNRGSAQKIVSQQITQSEIIWRGVKRR